MRIVKQREPYAGGKHNRNRTHHETGTDEWICLDGEGETIDGVHRYVLLGVGNQQIENRDGLSWREIFTLIELFHKPRRAFCGFYLSYDFTQWLKTLPE